MASSFFALLDDISVLMDDVATMSKVATEKTAGILGDDLAVNAEKSSDFLNSRELPVLWQITKASLLNKVMILPVAFLLSAFVPIVITIILIMGGMYLSYEGVEKIIGFLFHSGDKKQVKEIVGQTDEELKTQENERVKSAVFVDFILSIEIVIIALSTVTKSTILVQIIVVTLIALLATVGVYGIVALIVRMDDMGYKLIKANKSKFANTLGMGLVNALPWVIKTLNVVGTVALILVAGGIFTHNLYFVHDLISGIPKMLADTAAGLVVGLVAVLVVLLFKKIKSKPVTN
ncbi:MAG: putative DNA repair protein MutK [Bacteroidia bacterium]|jgi:predicted DNA repair protein MutK